MLMVTHLSANDKLYQSLLQIHYKRTLILQKSEKIIMSKKKKNHKNVSLYLVTFYLYN